MRIKELREKTGLSMRQTAAKLNMPYTTYVNYEKGTRGTDSEVLRLLSDYFDVSIDYLLGRTDDSIRYVPTTVHGGVKIPVIGIVQAGVPIEAIENIIDYIDISSELAASGDFFALKVRGASMEPRIYDGDVVIVRKQDYIESSQVAVVMVNGDSATVKKVVKHPNGLSLIPFNPAFDPMFFSAEEVETLPVTILGRVYEQRGKL